MIVYTFSKLHLHCTYTLPDFDIYCKLTKAAAAAAKAAEKAQAAIETGDAELAAEAALECQEAAMASNEFIQKEIQKTQDLKQRLTKLGIKVEVLKGSQPIDVMTH